MALSLNDILMIATQKGASDVHLKAGIIPVIRKHGRLRPLSSSAKPLTGTEIEKMAFDIMDEDQKAHFTKYKDIDMSYGISGYGRFRVNVLKQRGTVRMVIRYRPDRVNNISDLNLPQVVQNIAELPRGLVLVTGATGSGKSSTLAAMIDHINRTSSKHILMIEDPTEFLIKDRKSIITQRELGTDTISFAHSLRAALRQDPDVILIGEMRDRETIEIAMLAAETGHLVLSTLHTIDAQETINRIIAVFDPVHQSQIRIQLASVLKSVISQRLCMKKDNSGYTPALEVLINNSRVMEFISNPQRTVELRKVMEESQSAWGMQTFDQCLMDLISKDLITYEEALKTSTSPENFAIRYSGVSHLDGKNWGEGSHLKKQIKDRWQNLSTIEMETAISDIHKKRSQKKQEKKAVVKQEAKENENQGFLARLKGTKK